MLNIVTNKKLLFQIALIFLLGGAIIVEGTQVFSKPYQYQGSLIEPASPAPSFKLPSTTGEEFDLEAQRGKVVLLFFGYTHCPDICPTTLNDFKQVKNHLGGQADHVQFVFVTADPQRDTMKAVRDYVSIFDPGFIGVTAPEEKLKPVWDAYGVFVKKREVGSAAGYLVDHTARIYVVNPEGKLRLTFPQGMAPEAMADDISHLLDES